MFQDLLAGHELGMQLAVRDIKSQYRQAMLGILWAFLFPLANTAVWLFIKQAGITNIQDTSIPYPVYILTGTTLWAIFMESVNAPLMQANAARSMLAKINFPKESLILAGIYKTLFNATIKSIIILGGLLIVGISIEYTIVFYPFAICSLILAGTGFGLILTPIGMLYKDVGKGVPVVMQFLMYISPVVYPIPADGWAKKLFILNPLTCLITTARDFLTGVFPQNITIFLVIIVCISILLLLSWYLYRISMPIIIERISS